MKHIQTKKLITALLAATTLCGWVIGCKNQPNPPKETDTKALSATTEGITTEEATTEADEPSEPTIRDRYGDLIESLGSYANYGFREVEETPLLDLSFDSDESLNTLTNHGSVGGTAAVSNASGAQLIAGRFDLRGSLEFTTPNTYVTAPDLGEQEALTVSLWVNLKDISTRESDDDTRVTTLLDTQSGAGRVTLSFVHTGSTLNTDESGALVSNPKSTKLVFSVEGNEGGTFEEDGLYAKNEHYSNFEYTIPRKYNTWIAHEEGHCWFHIGIVYQPSTGEVTFYHNGKLDSTQRFDTAVKPVLNGVRIGGGYGADQSLDGKIDDIRLYGTALTAEDMENLADFERDMWVYRTIADWEDSEITYYVDGVKGNDDNPGTKDAPFATVKKGVESITKEGTRLVIAPGVYREAGINLNASGTEYKPIIIEAEVPGETVINGSTLMEEWETTTTPHVYRHDWDYRFARQTSEVPGNEILARSDMIWVDGEPMLPVFSMEELVMDSYYLDEATGEVYLMTEKNPDKFVAEVPNLGNDGENNKGAYLLKTNSNQYFVLRGLTFTGASTVMWDHSMVSLGVPHHVLVEDCAFLNSNTAGIGWDTGWYSTTAEDILIRRCTFDNNGTSAISPGFRTMNFVVEDSMFTDIGWKIEWGKYSSPDPATVKMMVCKNVIYRGNRFDNNIRNDLWFDNFNWNIEVVGNTFTNNHSKVDVQVEINTHGVLVRNNVMTGGVHWGNAEGMILDGNVFYGDDELISHYDDGAEYRVGDIGPRYGWKDMILTNNTFCYAGLRNEIYMSFPKYDSAADLTSAENRYFVDNEKVSVSNKGFDVTGIRTKFSRFLEIIGDTTSVYLTENPFADDGTATVAFQDSASTALGKGLSNYIPVVLSKPLNKESSVSYTVWNYDTNEIIRTGTLEFGQFESEKAIYIEEYNQNVLIELTDAENIALGKNTFHYQMKTN